MPLPFRPPATMTVPSGIKAQAWLLRGEDIGAAD
jgi:hypothetical protein